MLAIVSASEMSFATTSALPIPVSLATVVWSYTSVSQNSLPALCAAGYAKGVQPYSWVAMIDVNEAAVALPKTASAYALKSHQFCVSGAMIFTPVPAKAGPMYVAMNEAIEALV